MASSTKVIKYVLTVKYITANSDTDFFRNVITNNIEPMVLPNNLSDTSAFFGSFLVASVEDLQVETDKHLLRRR